MNTALIALYIFLGLAALVLLMLFPMGEYLFRTVFSRNQPKAVAYHEPPREKMNDIDQKRYDDRRQLEQMPSERWELTAKDGTRLVAHYLAIENAKRTVVLLHGWRSTWARDFGMHTKILRALGSNLLFVEQRAHGESGGKYIGFGALEQYDCLQWLQYLQKQKQDGLPVYLFGVSMGAATVLMASDKLQEGSVQGIIADSGFTSPSQIIAEVMRQKHAVAPKATTALLGIWTRMRAHFSISGSSTLTAMKKNRTPVLFIHGKRDDFVPIEMSLQCYAACRAEKRLLTVDGAPHAKAIIVAPTEYEQAITDFFGDHDK